MEKKVLAGPILRRTTKNRVCVWLATSEPMTLQLTVIDAKKKTVGKGDMNNRMNPQGIQLGERLFVHLLQARSANTSGYKTDALMFYKIDEVRGSKNNPLFSKEGLKKLTYGDHPYPSFFITSKLKNLLHGSCRKPHGEVRAPDALSQGHSLMEKTFDKLNERPAILMLTGDQIYADDVAISLNALLRDQALQLTGKPEQMPEIGNPKKILLHGRKQTLKEKKSGFSSGESANHLLSFGEYAAMYLYVFGNLPGWNPIWDLDKLKKLGIASGQEKDAEKAYKEQESDLNNFHKTLPDVRRLLANIPTYMMFDDHDVTDDWNITHGWYDDVRESKLGRRIVSNALAACWAFQSWGNDPDNFSKDMVWSIQQHLTHKSGNSDRYDLHTWKHRGWGFSVPTFPPIIAIDSRTQRQYDNYNMPAQLMDRYALDWLRMEWAKIISEDKKLKGIWPVLIAGTPVLGFAPIEGLQNWVLRGVKRFISYIGKRWLFFIPWFQGPIDRALVNALDIESWTANKKGYKALFDTLQARMKLPGCLFLSGDVHYAFSATGKFICEKETFPSMQLTSSALSNTPSKGNRKLLTKLGERLPKGAHGKFFAWGKRKRWKSKSLLIRPQEKQKSIYPEANIGLVQFSNGRPVNHTLLTADGKRTYKLKQ